MPIVYEPPTPAAARVSAAGPSYAQTYAQLYGESLANNARVQVGGAQLTQERELFQQREDAQRRALAQSQQFSPRDEGMAQSQMAEQAQRFQLQAQLNQQELSQAENIRLQRLKQHESAVREQFEAGQLTPEEAGVMLTRLKTSIDPLEVRRASTQQKAMETQQKMADFQYQRAVDREHARTKLESTRFEDRWGTFVDPDVKEHLGQELAATNPQFATLRPEQQQALVTKEAVKRGLYRMGFKRDDGSWDVHLPLRAGGASAGGQAAKPGEEPHPVYNATQNQYLKELQVAQKQAREDLKLEVPGAEPNTKKRVHPVPDDQISQWMEGRIQQHLERAFGKRQAPAAQDAERSAKPFDPIKMENASDAQRQAIGNLNAKLAAVSARQDIPAETKNVLVAAMSDFRGLIGKYGSKAALQAKAAAGGKEAREDLKLFDFLEKQIGQHMPADMRPQPPKPLDVNQLIQDLHGKTGVDPQPGPQGPSDMQSPF